MNRSVLVLTALMTLLLSPTSPAVEETLRIATWDLEWLIAPEEFRKLSNSCVTHDTSPGPRKRSIPCNVARKLDRSALDFQVLERYANQLDADIIALQEVDGVSAARKVFRNHDFCFTRREGVQNTGFAIRKGVPHRCSKDFIELSLDNQVPILTRWINEEAATDRRFAILGDFNHDLLANSGSARNEQAQPRNFWAEIDDGKPEGTDLLNIAEGQPFTNCAPSQNYRSYIDHVVLGAKLAEWRVPNSFIRLTYDGRDVLERKLADHCPVGVDLYIPH